MKRTCYLWFIAAVLLTGIPALGSAGSPEQDSIDALAAVSSRPDAAERVYFYNVSGGEQEAMAFKDRLIERGGFHVNAFLPDFVVGDVPADLDMQELLDGSGFSYRRARDVFPSAAEVFPGMDLIARSYELARKLNLPPETPPGGLPPADWRESFHDSALTVPPELLRLPPHMLSMLPNDEDVRLSNQNSEFLLGNILVLVICPESQSGPESWSDEELSDVSMGVYAAMLSFQEGPYSYASMNFTFKIDRRTPTSFEPIRDGTMELDYRWINDIMLRLGYPAGSGEAVSTVHGFNEYWRAHYAGSIDWVFTAFVANSETVYNHLFDNGNAPYTAYALIGGPYLVIPFPAGENPYHIDETLVFSQVFQHESCHIFWALDEYYSHLTEGVSCHDRSGYLNYENLNKTIGIDPVAGPYGCHLDLVPCIMTEPKRDQGRPICGYTAGQLGLADANRNSVPDALDAAPTVEFEGSDVETVLTRDLTIRAKAISVAVPNRNPAFTDDPAKKSYAAVLKDAALTLDGTNFIYLIPDDGRFDETEEDLSFHVAGLPTGLTNVQLRVRAKTGLASPLLTKRIYNLGLSYSYFTVLVHPDDISLSWHMIGDTFNATFDLWRISHAAGVPDTVLIKAGLLPSGPRQNQFLPFAYVDTDVDPGDTYEYFVEGSYLVHYKTRSGVIKARAMLPIAGSQILSDVMPNPFDPRRGNVAFSILVPQSYRDTGLSAGGEASGMADDSASRSSALKVPDETPLDISIYDVSGRRVKVIESTRLYAQAVTYEWDGTNENNDPAPSGIYFLKAVAGPSAQVKKIVLLR
jgi:hypothetical protein